MPNDEEKPNDETNPTSRRMKNDVRLDDATVATKIQNYPEEIIDDVMWLAAFMRERCAGRFDILVDRTRKLGFNKTTENYFYRVLTGRYFTREEGSGRLLGSVENLANTVDKLRAGVQLAERAGKTPFIETGTYRLMRDLFDTIRAPETVAKFAVIIGPTGAQKSECGKHYCHMNNHGKCVHLEAPEKPSLNQFIVDLAVRYGHSRWSKLPLMKKDIASSVTDKKMILIDNVQRLLVPGKRSQPLFSYIQKLQDDSGCSIAMILAKDHAHFLTEGLEKEFFEQFEGRAGGRENFLILDEYTPREDLVEIATAYGLSTGKQTIDYLEGLSRRPGRVRILFDALQKAKMEAKARKATLTLDLIKEIRGEVA